MTEPEVPLSSILDCLQGAFPAALATCGADGTPNVTAVSIVQYVDDDRVALPRQFLRKTAANLDANPSAQALVFSPLTADQYLLDLEYLQTEREGAVFDSIAASLDAMAAQAGTSEPAPLRGVDVHRVVACRAVRDDPRPAAHPPRHVDVLSPLDEFVRRMAHASDPPAATRVALEGLEELYGFGQSILFAADGDRLRPLAKNGYHLSGSPEREQVPGLLRIATERSQVVVVSNMHRGLAMATAAPRGLEAPSGASGSAAAQIGFAGPERAGSAAAVPLVHRGRSLGVLYLEDEATGRFGPTDERLLRILGTQIAVTLSALEDPCVGDRAANGEPSPRLAVTYYQANDTVFFGDDYVIKGVPGRILWKLLCEHVEHGRVEFSNRELRLDEALELPPGNDNLDSRLVSLRRRLARGAWGIELDRIGRGRLQLRLRRAISLAEVPTEGPMKRAPSWPLRDAVRAGV